MREDREGYWGGRHASAWADDFNARSAELQQKAGVNPGECLRVKIVSGNNRTPLEDFFTGIIQREWVIPEAGNYFEHDESTHWSGVRQAHPRLVEVVMWAALVGLHELGKGERKNAERVGSLIDLVIDNNRSISHYKSLLENLGIDKSTLLPEFRYDTFDDYRNTIIALDFGEYRPSNKPPVDYDDEEEYYGFEG